MSGCTETSEVDLQYTTARCNRPQFLRRQVRTREMSIRAGCERLIVIDGTEAPGFLFATATQVTRTRFKTRRQDALFTSPRFGTTYNFSCPRGLVGPGQLAIATRLEEVFSIGYILEKGGRKYYFNWNIVERKSKVIRWMTTRLEKKTVVNVISL